MVNCFHGGYIIFIILVSYAEAYLIGEPCKYDEDCFVEHSYCEMQQICQCKENFFETEDRETCIALIGAYCHSKYDCNSLPHSICEDNRCVCESQFIADPQKSKCMPKATHIEGPCMSDLQCRASFGEYSQCEKGRCMCIHHYHSFEGGQCMLSKRLGEICHNNTECYMGEEHRERLDCIGGHCSCKGGFYDNGAGSCYRNGAASVSNEVVMTALMFLCIFSFNKRFVI